MPDQPPRSAFPHFAADQVGMEVLAWLERDALPDRHLNFGAAQLFGVCDGIDTAKFEDERACVMPDGIHMKQADVIQRTVAQKAHLSEVRKTFRLAGKRFRREFTAVSARPSQHRDRNPSGVATQGSPA